MLLAKYYTRVYIYVYTYIYIHINNVTMYVHT